MYCIINRFSTHKIIPFSKNQPRGLFFKKYSKNYANFSLDILTKYILIYKIYCTSIAQDYA